MNWLQRLYRKADLNIPAGVSADAVAERVANQIAKTVRHEAEHGARWAQEFYTNKRRLDQMNRSEEEGYSERAEEEMGLQTDLTEDIFDDTSEARSMSNSELLSRAIRIANSKSPFYIPTDAVEDARLASGTWGLFEAVQRPGEKKQAPVQPHVAWNEEKRKLQVDVADIVESYNRALSGIPQQPKPPTFQDDGTRADTPGVSRQPPTGQGGFAPATPATPAVPAVGAR